MKRLPFGGSRYARVFEEPALIRRYDAGHSSRARRLGRALAKHLAALGLEAGSILDAGAAAGHTALALAAALPDAQVVGLDLCEPLMQMARANAKQRGLWGRVTFATGNVQQMPFEDRRFDAVVSIDTLHVVDDPVAMINECERVLNPTGALLLVNIRRSWLGWLVSVLRTAYTRAEVEALLGQSELRPWRIRCGALYLWLHASRREGGP